MAKMVPMSTLSQIAMMVKMKFHHDGCYGTNGDNGDNGAIFAIGAIALTAVTMKSGAIFAIGAIGAIAAVVMKFGTIVFVAIGVIITLSPMNRHHRHLCSFRLWHHFRH